MTRKTKAQRQLSLIQELATLSFSPVYPDLKNFYAFSNETRIYEVISSLKKKSIKLKKNTIKVGVLIGESSFCSLLPELNCDVIVFADLNPLLISHVMLLLDLLLLSPNIEAFIFNYRKHGDLNPWAIPSSIFPTLDMRKEELKDLFFLSSEARFRECQLAAFNKDYAFCHANLFHPQDRERFFNCFKKRPLTKITFFNFTNLHEWDAKISLGLVIKENEWQPRNEIGKILEKLKSGGNAPIVMASLRACVEEDCALEAKLFSSPQEYARAYPLAVKKYLEYQFPSIPSSPPSFIPQFRNIRTNIPTSFASKHKRSQLEDNRSSLPSTELEVRINSPLQNARPRYHKVGD